MVIFEILIGLIPAYPLFLLTNKFLMSRKPKVETVKPTVITPLIKEYEQRQLEIEGRVAPKAVEEKKEPAPAKGKKDKRPENVLETNYKKWANNPADIPFVKKAVSVLKIVSEAAVMELSVEEQHNLEVLSNQTETLLSNWYETPEEVRNLSQVKEAFDGQLAEISEGAKTLTINASENLVRTLNIGTGFIQTKYNNKGNL